MIQTIKRLLAHPDTRDLSLDDPRTTEKRRGIIRSNRFLWNIYDEWYRLISAALPAEAGNILELGAGAGFLSAYIPNLITSEIFPCPEAKVVLDGRQLPFTDASLNAIVMVDVLHHIPDSRAFLAEAQRCIQPGGSILMIEPWVSTWSRLIYTYLHHEPFDPAANEWKFPDTGPLSAANGALPWIIFQRDRSEFEAAFPYLAVRQTQPLMPFRYLVSGGVSMRQLMPERAFGPWRHVESWLERWPDHWPMFAFIEIARH